MTEEYMPSVDEVRKYYDPSIAGRFKTFFSNPKKRNEDYAELSEGINAEFDRWLAAHDAEVRDNALTLTDDELAIAEGAYESSIMEYEDDGIEAMSIALDAVAKDRRNHEHRNG